MNKKILLFFTFISVILAYSIVVHSEENPELQKLFGDEEEIEVIVVLKDDYNVLEEYGISYTHDDDFEMKKMMISKQQDKIFKDLKLKKKDKELSAQNNENYDFDLSNTYTIVNGFAGKLKKSSYEKLKNDPNVLAIEKSKTVSAFLSDSAGIINATRAWGLVYNGTNITGKGQSVCIIDTGVDYTHPALGGCSSTSNINDGSCNKVIGGYNYCPTDSCDTENANPVDNNGHGTHVTGIVASTNNTYRGVAPDASIIAIKMLNSAGSGSTADLISAIDWCTNNATIFNISVISMSLGVNGYSSTTYCDADDNLTLVSSIHTAIGRNISVVVAAGNDNVQNGVSSPACISNVTVVGSTTKADATSSFSDRWGLPMLFAPGTGITSLKNGGGTESLSGTSMAAPHVSGVFALLRQYRLLERNITLTPFQLQNISNSTGKLFNDSSNGLTYTRVNVFNAILSMDSLAPNITFVAPTPANNSNLSNHSFIINLTSNEVLSIAVLEFNGTNETMNTTSIQLNWMLNKTINLSKIGTFGTFNYRIYGNDSAGNMKITPTLQINVNNTAPNITSFYPLELNTSISEPNNLTFNITVNDINGDSIITKWYQNSTLKSTINNFTFANNFSAAGFYNITVIVSDGGLETSLSWNLTVNNTCDTPFEISNITRNVTYCGSQIFNFSNGIHIGSNNVVLDCNSSVLNGNLNSGAGIYGLEKENITIKNCIIKKYQYGINLTNLNKIFVSLNNISDAQFSIYITNTNNSNLSSNLLENYDGDYNGYGIYLSNSNFNIINKNILNKAINDGHFGGSANTQCAVNAYDSAIFTYKSDFNNITSNLISSNRYGVYISCSHNNQIISNNISHKSVSGPTIFGVIISSSNNNLLKNNFLDINVSTGYGVSIDYPDFDDKSFNTTIINNSIINSPNLVYNNKNNLTIEYNYWGIINNTLISEKIYDNSNDTSFGIADFDPWYSNNAYTRDSDSDDDGFSNSSLGGSDCNDANNSINSNVTESRNEIDDDCDNIIDEGFALGNSSNINSTIIGLTVIINQSANLSKRFDGIQEILIGNSSDTLFEFRFNLSKIPLNLSNITIEKQASGTSKGSMFIRGVSIHSQTTKTAYVDNVSLFQGVCIKDSEISSLSEITLNCNGTLETWVSCPGSKRQYNCTINGTRWKIQGLNHSGIQQQNDTLPPVIVTISATNTGSNPVNVNLSVTTDENATCRFSTLNLTYGDMSGMLNTNNTIHSNSISYSSDTLGTYFVRCNDTYGNVMGFSNFTAFNADVQESSSGGGSSGGGGSGSGGGGGGGGAGLTFVCNMDWQCAEWSECSNGFQARSCNFVKVPQHVQATQCPLESDAPKTTQSCEVKKETPATALATEADNVNEQNAINQEQNLAAAQDSGKDKTGLAAITGALIGITEELNFWLACFGILVVIISAVLFYQFRKKYKK